MEEVMGMIEYLVQYKGEVKAIFAPDPKTAAMLAGSSAHPKYNPTSCLLSRTRISNVVRFRADIGGIIFVRKRDEIPCVMDRPFKKQ